MKSNKEIEALFALLDDPDQEVYEQVSKKIISMGKDIIPNLENYWEHIHTEQIQNRIETIIHKVNYEQFFQSYKKWINTHNASLLSGAFMFSRYRFPNMDEDAGRKLIKSMYQSCWLELNNFLTPLEQINIVNSIVYSMYKFTGYELDANKENHYYFSEVLDSRQGNNYTLGILYQVLCDMLDIPVFAIHLPKQHILAYFDTQYDFYSDTNQVSQKILFYIDANNGTIYTQNDVDVYLKKYQFENKPHVYTPLTPHEIMQNTIQTAVNMYSFLQVDDKVAELENILLLGNVTDDE